MDQSNNHTPLKEFALDFARDKWEYGWNSHQGNVLKECFHEEGTYWDPDCGLTTKDGVPDMIRNIEKGVPDYIFAVHPGTVIFMQTSPDTFNLALRWTMLGLNGKLRVPGIDYLEFKNRKIVRATTYFDNVQCIRQIKGKIDKCGTPTDTQDAIKSSKTGGEW
eukprot:CAMPEP_0203749636 /NCGR_PEP_ID=MMETSP0098-20131031/4119_1 /ASSEMBLY_ACC=CAM_ASM_000208 /TAXON_ID=96639 /ORGANISM=" , Strain NY0313808BC1" /LENGTH=162 /DNA_ID=CAMNT_0050638721 /DNA_START=108 /DNA_END=593 /DNA_ORIENTATION=+